MGEKKENEKVKSLGECDVLVSKKRRVRLKQMTLEVSAIK